MAYVSGTQIKFDESQGWIARLKIHGISFGGEIICIEPWDDGGLRLTQWQRPEQISNRFVFAERWVLTPKIVRTTMVVPDAVTGDPITMTSTGPMQKREVWVHDAKLAEWPPNYTTAGKTAVLPASLFVPPIGAWRYAVWCDPKIWDELVKYPVPERSTWWSKTEQPEVIAPDEIGVPSVKKVLEVTR